LRNADGVRLAILVNEFGELPIDEDLIEAQDDDIISIAGGCVCCSYGDDLTMALYDLAKMNERPDHVLLEASGVALPGAIAASISLIDGYALDGVLVLADAETVRDQAIDPYVGDTITRQINDADLIVLNKSDLQSMAQLDETHAWFKEQSPNVEVIPATHGVLPPETLLQSFLGRQRRQGSEHVHQANIFATSHFTIEAKIDTKKLAAGLAHASLGLVRAKGFVKNLNGEIVAIQIVGRRWEVRPAPANVSLGLVAITGKSNMDKQAIANLIAQLSE